MSEGIEMIELSRLRAHPGNANVMREDRFEKLVRHIEGSGRYPPLVVREVKKAEKQESRKAGNEGDEASTEGSHAEIVYEVLDGHHRWRALERLGHESAACVVWEVDDEQALVLLGTLNRLQGADDPRKRSELLNELNERFGRSVGELARMLPEPAEEVKKLLSLRLPRPRPAAAPRLEDMPTAVHFFLKAEEKRRLEGVLERMGGGREEALMKMVARCEESAKPQAA